MQTARAYRRRTGPRDLLYFSRPDLWPLRPFLALMRYPTDGPGEEGILYDAVHVSGTYGYAATVFLANILLLPRTEGEFLALPHEIYDTPEELADDGWVVD
jgi:hypothetical protein